MAILGTESLDVTRIDPTTVRLVGVAPLKWSSDDVSEPVVDPADECECIEGKPDGHGDLVFHFRTQDLVDALGGREALNRGDVLALEVTAQLYDGRDISGIDCMVVR